jgi:hemolysin activation/secretion protein
MVLAQNAVIEHGYTTTRILAGEQDLKRGQLILTVVPGRLAHIRFLDTAGNPLTGRAARHIHALPTSPGDILNLHELEQALENLKRIPTTDVDIQIIPADTPNESDLLIRWTQRAIPLRGMIGLDDAGSRATGKYQANITLFADSPLGLSDLFYLTYNHHILRAPRRKSPDSDTSRSGTHGWGLHYSVPYGNWLLGINHNAYRYHQAVAGLIENYDYNGKSEASDLGLTRLLSRNARGKTSLHLKLWRRESRNYIDDTEIDIQYRRTFGWALDLEHKATLGKAAVSFGLGYRRGTGAGKSLRAPEEDLGEGTARPQIVTADIALAWPFAMGAQTLAYNTTLHAQWHRTRLVLQDQISLGGRYTVRGFDGETLLAGDRGGFWRNTLEWYLLPAHQLYLGADMGRVGGPATRTLPGRSLAGAVVGIKGQFLPGGQIAYDLFIGGPLHKPRRFETEATVVGFNLNYSL